jgi:hypothetical protein
MTGKSSFGSVARLKVDRPAVIVSRPEAHLPSGSPARHRAVCARSHAASPPKPWSPRGVPPWRRRGPPPRCPDRWRGSDTCAPSASISTLARIGIVLRRSTTDCACASALSKRARSIESFILPNPLHPLVQRAHDTIRPKPVTSILGLCGGLPARQDREPPTVAPQIPGRFQQEIGRSALQQPLQQLRSSFNWLSVAISSSILRTPCMIVVWSRPPKRRPISGRLRGVSCLARYIAT